MKRFLHFLIWLPAILFAQSQDPCYSINDYNTQTKDLNPAATVDLPEGWSMFGYSCKDSIDAVVAFEQIRDKILIVKDEWGLSYLPEWEYNALGNLAFSEGYQIKLKEQVADFSFCEGVLLPTVEGCRDCEALNFNPWATKEDGTCEHDTDGDGVNDSDEIVGCQDETACNYDQTATDSGDCTFLEEGYDCDGTPLDTDGDGVNDLDEVIGCQDESACNYDQTATDSGDCTFLEEGYDCDGTPLDTDGDGVNDIDEVIGCQDESACNYNETATDQGDCTFAEQGRDCEGNLLYAIGAEIEGGYLFYIDDEMQYGLVTLSYSPGSNDYWEGCTDQLINTSVALGAGQDNFQQIRQQCPFSTISSQYRSYSGFDDWYIPSKEELDILYQQKGNLPTDPFIVSGDPYPSFISSSTIGSDKFWLMNSWGNWTDIWRSNGARVLPIRKVLFYDPPGCTDSQACNYNIEAGEDDGSCIYPNESGICAFDISCGSTQTGSTANAENNLGNPSPEHIYKLEATTSGMYEFSTCGSDYDTFLRIYDANMTELYSGDDDGDCGNKTILNKSLDPGTYFILIEGYLTRSGDYILVVSCP